MFNILAIMVVLSMSGSLNAYAGWENNVADGTWKYTENSAYVTGWKLVDSKWYFMGADGKMMANQWVMTNNLWYYVGADGAMLINTVTPDGYNVDINGVCWDEELEEKNSNKVEPEAGKEKEATTEKEAAKETEGQRKAREEIEASEKALRDYIDNGGTMGDGGAFY